MIAKKTYKEIIPKGMLYYALSYISFIFLFLFYLKISGATIESFKGSTAVFVISTIYCSFLTGYASTKSKACQPYFLMLLMFSLYFILNLIVSFGDPNLSILNLLSHTIISYIFSFLGVYLAKK